MHRHDFLAGIHSAYEPRNYLEIGINNGLGLRLTHTRTIGVDPSFTITHPFECDLQMVRATSDDFFARENPIGRFPEGVIDFAFIDGLHIFEYALRDFMNVERLSAPSSVIVLDDMLPRMVAEAARDRHTGEWTGDVYKVIAVLDRYRPDLTVVPIDTTPTGVLVVLGADPTSTVLQENYDQILVEYAVPDPQAVPDDIIHRRIAADPLKALTHPVWADLVAAREAGTRPDSVADFATLRGTASFVSNPPTPNPWPPAKPESHPEAVAATKAAKGAGAKGTSAPSAPAKAGTMPPIAAKARSFAGRVRRAVKARL